MNYQEFMGQVQSKAKFAELQDAVRATRVVLQTLAERLDANEADDLAAQLPEEIGLFLKNDEPGERFDFNEFVQRVSERENVDPPAAVYHIRVVFEQLREATSAGEIEDVKEQLPPEYHKLFEVGSTGDLSS